MKIGSSVRPAAVLLALWLGGGEAVAQCVMCGQAAANAGDPEVASRTFAIAILVLLIPVALLLASAGLLLWRFRHDVGGGYREIVPPVSTHPTSAPRVLSMRRRKSS
jgi:hypothetical protein